MIKKIRRRFIKIALLALALAMLIVAGAINAFHLASTFGELNTTLSYIAESENGIYQEKQKSNGQRGDYEKEEAGKEEDGSTKDSGRQDGKKNHDHRMRTALEESRYFIAIKEADGELHLGLGSKETEYSEEELLSIAAEIFESGSDSGFSGYYQYRVTQKPDGSQTAVFLNCESKFLELATLAVISLVACAAGILLAWLMVALLSKKAIRPMVQNMEQQKQFITNAGHELKTPLTVISANMDVLSMDIGPNEWVCGTQKQVSQMRKLVNELIYLSRMDEADSRLNKSSFNLSNAVREVAEPFTSMAEFNGKNMIVSAEDDLKYLGDEQALRRLISTLCENAVKYAPEDSDVKLSLTHSGKNVVFSTENKMKEPLGDEAILHLFDRFYRGDVSRSKEENAGFGIGLSIARAIAEKHGGTVSAKKTANEELIITCTLPV